LGLLRVTAVGIRLLLRVQNDRTLLRRDWWMAAALVYTKLYNCPAGSVLSFWAGEAALAPTRATTPIRDN